MRKFDFDKHGKWTIALLSVLIVALFAGTLFYEEMRPYAVYADGTKINDPYVISVDNEEQFLVEDKETAEKVIANVIEEYIPEGHQVNLITLDKKLAIGEKDLERTDEPERVFTEAEAVSYILEKNESDEPLFSATVESEAGSIESVAPQEKIQETDELYEGDYIVKTEGTEGSRIVTSEVTSVNGEVTEEEKVGDTIVDYGQAKITLKGTKDIPADTAWQDYSGSPIGEGNAASVADYGLKFTGNPYVYGGSSLTGGTDCSGFTMRLYRTLFGISLPHSSSAQAHCGKGISLAQAKPGDIVCYSGHVAIYLGNNRIVHAANPRKDICVSGVHSCGKILTVRRIVD